MAGVIARSVVRGPRGVGSSPSSQIRQTAELEQGALNEGFLARVVALLTPSERTVLRLRHRHGLSERAIAARLAVPTAAVHALLTHAETTLRAAQRAFIDALIEQKR